jgi:hypothetical protein
MLFIAAVGDEMFPAIASFRREFAEREVLRNYPIESADAIVNSPDRLLGRPALLYLCLILSTVNNVRERTHPAVSPAREHCLRQKVVK